MKITPLTKEIQLNNTVYPLNSLIFREDGDFITIWDINFKLIINDIYSNFIDNSDVKFSSPSDVVNALKQSIQ